MLRNRTAKRGTWILHALQAFLPFIMGLEEQIHFIGMLYLLLNWNFGNIRLTVVTAMAERVACLFLL